jgi:hypothetical protein
MRTLCLNFLIPNSSLHLRSVLSHFPAAQSRTAIPVTVPGAPTAVHTPAPMPDYIGSTLSQHEALGSRIGDSRRKQRKATMSILKMTMANFG